MKKSPSILAGIMITAGCTIGAGMFSLPIVSSGMWFSWSLLVMLFLWFLNYLSSLILLEINLQYPAGASFDTFVADILGKGWNFVTGIGIAFLLYILLYAYFSAFGNIISHMIGTADGHDSRWLNGLLSFSFGGLLSQIVWRSTKLVGRLSTILVVGMVVTFIISMSGLSLLVDSAELFELSLTEGAYHPYVWAALPYFLTSFGFASVVPSLYKFYGQEPDKIKYSLLVGSLIALAVYVLFIFVCFGLIPRNDFIDINASGGNMGDLVSSLTANVQNPSVSFALNLFSNFAIITSFLGVGLSLFDYIADRFKFPESPQGRFKTACVTFLPSGLASFFFPHGFVAAIGFAGLVMVFSYFTVPFLMAWKTRRQKTPTIYRMWGGKPMLIFVLLASTLVVVCHILAMLEYLPRL